MAARVDWVTGEDVTAPAMNTLGAEINTKISAANLSMSRSTTAVVVVSDTGSDATVPAADGSNAGVMTAAMQTKLAGITPGAGVVDATTVAAAGALMTAAAPELVRDTIGTALTAGANITITPSDVGDTIIVDAADALTATTAPELIRDTMGSTLVAGANVSLVVDDVGEIITVNAVGGSGATNLSSTQTPTVVVVASDTGADAVLPAADGSNSGVMTAAMQLKLAGIEPLADVTDAANVAAAGGVMAANLTELVQDIVAAMIIPGSGVNTAYNDTAGGLTITFTAGGGGTGFAIPAAIPAVLL